MHPRFLDPNVARFTFSFRFCCCDGYGDNPISSNVEFPNGVVLLNEDACRLLAFINCLNGGIRMFKVRFPSPNCKMLLQD